MRKHLLVIIDDEEDLLDLFEYNFKKQGFEVAIFDRAKPALDFVSKNRPDMILCDWMMPGMTGLELCQSVKNNLQLADVPFVMVTCRNEPGAKQAAISAGATEFIPKPIPIQKLLEKVNRILVR
ncbi:MAG: response regulator [Bacteroidota bacterium]